MELILINERKLKIMLTAEEMRLYELDGEFCTGRTDVSGSIRPVLEKARQSCGFDAADEKVMVQLFPSRAGGCEMFVTKLAASCGGAAASAPPHEVYYSFGSISDLLGACRSLAARGLGDHSRAYRSGEKCLLSLLPGDAARARVDEFGSPESACAMRIYIPEHAERLCPSGENDAAFLGRF